MFGMTRKYQGSVGSPVKTEVGDEDFWSQIKPFLRQTVANTTKDFIFCALLAATSITT